MDGWVDGGMALFSVPSLAEEDFAVGEVFVLRDFQVERSGALTNPTTRVVVTAVTAHTEREKREQRRGNRQEGDREEGRHEAVERR